MTGPQPSATVFERGSNVHEYWLAHAEGFHVVSRRKPRARVDHVVVDRELGSATTLVVRRKRGRRTRHIPAVSVSAVDPFERVLYLTPKRRAHTAVERLRPRVAHAYRMFAFTATRAAAVVYEVRLACVRGARWSRPRLADAGRRARVASTQAYRTGRAFSLAGARTTRRGSLTAWAWLRVASARAYRASRGLSVEAAGATRRHSLVAYGWLRPRLMSAARRAGRGFQSAPHGIRTRGSTHLAARAAWLRTRR